MLLHPPHFDPRFADLRALYWRLRCVRSWDSAARRRIYRLISAERKKFDGLGVDQELLRVFCRHLANPADKHAEKRYLMRLELLREDSAYAARVFQYFV
jgi:hypothetical protein